MNILILNIWSQAVSANPLEIKRVPMISCILNKSYTLEIYKEIAGEEQSLVIENKSFLENIGGGKKIVNLNLKQAYKVEYGNVLMYTFDYGRSGYFFMRLEKNIKVSDIDLGNSTFQYDNNIFQQKDQDFFTNGRMKQIANCTYVGS
jgi:hypothetical protein